MGSIRLYVDEDASRTGLLAALRRSSIETVSVADAGLLHEDDPIQLDFATTHGLVIYSFNVRDFQALHTERVASGLGHAGIILGHQQRYSVGEQLRRILRIRDALSNEVMRNRVEFLSKWG